MFDHVTIRVSNREASERFYELVLGTLGSVKTSSDAHGAEWNDFSLSPTTEGKPVTRHLHIGFVAPSRAEVEEFHRALLAAGYRDNGPPGERPVYHEGYYGAFVLDPDGNNIELVNHNRG